MNDISHEVVLTIRTVETQTWIEAGEWELFDGWERKD